MHTQAVLPVRRDGDVDDRVAETHEGRERLPDFGVRRQVDDAFVVVGQTHLALGTEHAVAVDAADIGRLQVQACAGNGRAGRREHALHAGPRVRRAADHLNLLGPGIDDADPELVGIRVLFGADHMGDRERRQFGGAVDHLLDLQADVGQFVDDGLQVGIRLQMLLEPGEREFHRLNPPPSVGTSSGTKP